MSSITKKILLIALPLMLNACAYDVDHYIPTPYGVNVTPAPRVYSNNGNYQKLYHNNQPNYQQNNGNYNEHHHHDNGKHKGQHKNKHHHDD